MQKMQTLGMSEADSYKLLALRTYIKQIAVTRKRYAHTRFHTALGLTLNLSAHLQRLPMNLLQKPYLSLKKPGWQISVLYLKTSSSRQPIILVPVSHPVQRHRMAGLGVRWLPSQRQMLL